MFYGFYGKKQFIKFKIYAMVNYIHLCDFISNLLKRPYGLVPPTCLISHEQHIIDANSSQRPLSRWELSDCNVMGLRYFYMSRWCYESGSLNEDMYYWNTDEVSDMSPPADS